LSECSAAAARPATLQLYFINIGELRIPDGQLRYPAPPVTVLPASAHRASTAHTHIFFITYVSNAQCY